VRVHRLLVPLAAAVVLTGIFFALRMALHSNEPDMAELLALKSQAEALAIENKLPEAHAKYRELLSRAEGHDSKDRAFWDLMERVQNDQEWVYRILLAQRDPARVLTPPLPATGASTMPVASVPSATTQSFVEVHPPYQGVTTAPATVPAVARGGANPTTETTQATTLPSGTAVVLRELPDPKHFKIARASSDPSGFSDAMVGEALAKSNAFLLAQFKDGEIQQGKEFSETYRQGVNLLCLYALIHSGEATRDSRLAVTGEFMREALDKIKLLPLSTDTSKAQQPIVYARSLRAAILAEANRPEDRDLLKDDVQWLVSAAVDGAYTYDDRFTVRVIGADPHAGRPDARNLLPPPPKGLNPPAKPKTLGPTKDDKPDDGAPKPGAGGGAPIAPSALILYDGDRMARPAEYSGELAIRDRQECLPHQYGNKSCVVGAEPDAPLDIQLVDGLHDPRTGMELGPPRRYPPPLPPPHYPPQSLPEKYDGIFIWDNSNSQYGLLGVWAAAEVGIEVPDAYFAAVEKHWLGCQLANGQWPYRRELPVGRLAMTAAGIASLYVTHDYLEAPSVAKLGRQATAAGAALAQGFAWLENGDNAVDMAGPQTVYLGYTLHALSRVGLASGYKYLGAHDWYRELARQIVQSQWENGAWGRTDQSSSDTLIDTAYTALFLARGRHPILMNKLRLDSAGKNDRGEWNNRPRDLANLARFASRELERPLNWQIVSIDREPGEWSDAPILYIASHAALRFSDEEVAKIRAFVDAGGLLFTQADNGSESFNLYVNQLAKQLFPEFELKDLSPDDELYTLQYIIAKPNRPRLRGVRNGSRLLWVHSPTDLAVNWQQRAEKTKREAFEMGVNLFAYASGKAELRNRLEERAIAKPNFAASSSIAIARLKYSGQWDPEPAAWPRFARYFQWETSVAIEPTVVDLGAATLGLSAGQFPIAHLTGSAAFAPSEAQIKALREYVLAGGTLIVEAVGGVESPFTDSLQSSILPKAFPEARLEALPAEHPMLHASFKGMEDVWPTRARPYAMQKLKAIPQIRQANVGKGSVIYLPLDATSGLLGSYTWGIFGYDPNEARAMMKNIVLWTGENRR
jgi:hypothetical protein